MRFVRWLTVCGLALAFCTPGHLADAAPRPAVVVQSGPIVERFTGGSVVGQQRGSPHFGTIMSGTYASSGQLGRGTFLIDDFAVPPPPVRPISFRRSDGMLMRGGYRDAQPPNCGSFVTACLHATLHGSGDVDAADVYIVGGGVYPDYAFLMSGTLTLRARHGYTMVDSTGVVRSFGGIEHFGDAATGDVVDIQRTPSGRGYWVVNAAGHVYAFGDARYFGGTDPDWLPFGPRITSMSATPSGNGYWLFTADGRALRFGDAQLYGDLHVLRLARPIVDSIATPTGHGYYMVGADGGVFAFGDARFRGSMGATRLAQPVVGIVPTPANTGYWLVAADGGVFSFAAQFRGSMGGTNINRPVVGMAAYGAGYLMVADDGGIFDFSNSMFFGSASGSVGSAPVVSITAIG
jgi:hypothetical protein